MQTRTHLTTPPGQEPIGGASSSREEHEAFVPGLALPTEPRPPGRLRALWITLASIVGLVVLVVVGYEYATQGQDFDPALDPSFETELPQDPGEPAPGLDTGDAPTDEQLPDEGTPDENAPSDGQLPGEGTPDEGTPSDGQLPGEG